jgi:hypothetical protein
MNRAAIDTVGLSNAMLPDTALDKGKNELASWNPLPLQQPVHLFNEYKSEIEEYTK